MNWMVGVSFGLDSVMMFYVIKFGCWFISCGYSFAIKLKLIFLFYMSFFSLGFGQFFIEWLISWVVECDIWFWIGNGGRMVDEIVFGCSYYNFEISPGLRFLYLYFIFISEYFHFISLIVNSSYINENTDSIIDNTYLIFTAERIIESIIYQKK